MTTVASFRSRGVVCLRKYKDLVFIIALLSLLFPVSSWIGKKELKNINTNLQELKQDAAMRKLENKMNMALILLMLEEITNGMDTLSEIIKQFPDLLENLKDLKVILDESLFFLEKKFQDEAQEIKDYEDTLRHLESFLRNLDEEHSEL